MDNSLKVLSKFYTVMLGILLYINLFKILKSRLRPHYSKSESLDQKKFFIDSTEARSKVRARIGVLN